MKCPFGISDCLHLEVVELHGETSHLCMNPARSEIYFSEQELRELGRTTKDATKCPYYDTGWDFGGVETFSGILLDPYA